MLIIFFKQYFQGVYDSLKFYKIIYKSLYIESCRRLLLKLIILNYILHLGGFYLLNLYCYRFIENYSNECIILNQFIWMYPLFLINYFLNIKYHNDFIKEYFNYYLIPHKIHICNIKRYIAHKIWYHLIFIVLVIICYCLGYIPIIGGSFYFISVSLLYSLYCWEYWCNYVIISFDSRFETIQKNIFYFLGYGTIFGVVKIYFDYLYSYLIISLLFPLLSIVIKETKMNDNDIINIPIFRYIYLFIYWFFSYLRSLIF